MQTSDYNTYDEAAYLIELKVGRLFPASSEPMTETRHAYQLMRWDKRSGVRDEFKRYDAVIAADMAANPDCKHRAAIRSALDYMRFPLTA